MSDLRLPDNTQRLCIMGQTGSGKTVFGMDALSLMPFDKQPYIVFDYKIDPLIEQIEGAKYIGVGTMPKEPGLYIVQPDGTDEDEAAVVNQWLWKIWQKGRIGLFFDEMYSIPDPRTRPAIRAIFTQGRSKRIPVIACTQRPAWVSRFLFSEASFFVAFHLQLADDIKAAATFVPGYGRFRLPQYHALYYDVSRNKTLLLTPSEGEAAIVDRFNERLRRKRRIF